ncbi:unnamed protein product (macronuclear) [Paramecium tetraurelia]|uniref:Uncharacterized protein n=1 Tax=Paramecium tetraurelia TaxID=5888 RepID=A0BCL8_PARTE|nr:uncharacterized protein GSPATT00004379001 [Paramecium tetraurelia]CAK56285.1 unnamed protein product [Paramecium tetraurelia]|eukprot:XP_001423683.1 hypothetical protein (macronuclear) [Paramecium tetraurelia strain d4-2]
MNHSEGAQSPPYFGMYPLPYWPTSSQFLLMMNFQNPMMSPIHNLGSPILTSHLNFTQPTINYDIKYEQNSQNKESTQTKQPQQYTSQIQIISEQLDDMNYDQITVENLEALIHLLFAEEPKLKKIQQQLKEKRCLKVVKILDTLAKKIRTQQKNREELIKFCLRKAFREIFHQIQEKCTKKKLNLKAASKIFQQTYQAEKMKSIALPFRKNSKNKTMNNHFLHELFQSKQFQDQYKIFLDNLDTIIENDKNKKIKAIAEKSWEFIQSNRKSYTFKRLPWSLKNLEKLKETANEMLNYCDDQKFI